ncbi:hypothetical protein [Novosphingobium sp. BL-52-GroH]|uniref:hypothetical protein n=1 Tax=Novosphingobium sp. BL-52-GroH TaxID=3349877 RepID=UPI00384D2F23
MTTRRVLKPASQAKPKSQQAVSTGSSNDLPPRRGEVINYVYLFAAEQAAGRDEGVKDRPVIVIAADGKGYIVLAVTTKGEINPSNAIPIPGDVGRAMGLPYPETSSVVVSEANSFDWMGFDVRAHANGDYRYGMVTPGFFQKIVTEFLSRSGRSVNRR